MAIIVPEAQTPFSIVEQPRQNPNAPTGFEGIGALADVGISWQARKVKAENDRILREARLGALQELDTARIEFETTGDMDGLADRWDAKVAEVTSPRAEKVPKHLRKDFDLSMRETIAPQTAAIRRRENALFMDRERASMNTSLRGYEKAAANAPDEASREAILRDAGAVVQSGIDAGLISSVEGEKIMADLPANTARVEAMGLIDEDPQAYLDRADEFAATLDPAEHKRNTIAAKGAVAAEEARLKREDELLAGKAAGALKTEVDGAIDILESGRPVSNLPDLLARTEGTPEHDRLMATVDAVGTETNFALMTPAEQKAFIKAESQTPTGDPADVGRLNRLRDMNRRTEESLKADPIAHIRDREIADVPAVNVSDPASVADRISLAEAVYEQYTPGAASVRYFDQGEVAQLTAQLNSDDPDTALAVLSTIQRNFGTRAPLALAQLGEKDPTAYLAGALMMDTGDTTASRYVLQGRRMVAKGEGAKVAAEVRRSVASEFGATIGWAVTPDGRVVQDPRRLELALQAADAHYAASAMGVEARSLKKARRPMPHRSWP
ncbi:hypothetical protein MASR1M32_10670 [Rhodobacter sp.]